jgi:hypothetical protein
MYGNVFLIDFRISIPISAVVFIWPPDEASDNKYNKMQHLPTTIDDQPRVPDGFFFSSCCENDPTV